MSEGMIAISKALSRDVIQIERVNEARCSEKRMKICRSKVKVRLTRLRSVASSNDSLFKNVDSFSPSQELWMAM